MIFVFFVFFVPFVVQFCPRGCRPTVILIVSVRSSRLTSSVS
jgi:hypothetical protein